MDTRPIENKNTRTVLPERGSLSAQAIRDIEDIFVLLDGKLQAAHRGAISKGARAAIFEARGGLRRLHEITVPEMKAVLRVASGEAIE